LAVLVRHCFPGFWESIGAIEDPRDGDRIVYDLKHVLGLAILMFACRMASRRALDNNSDDTVFLRNLCQFAGVKNDTVMTSAQMVNVLKVLEHDELAAIQVEMIRQLIASKRLPDAYIQGHLVVASDGTGIFSSSEEHCDKCLTQEHKDGSVLRMHNVLEAKVLSADGMALSLLSEPVENDEDGKYKKQDCETKAFKRLLPRIKAAFPRQPFVHLLDSLYANGPALKAIYQQPCHEFICNFKRGSISTLFDESLELIKLHPENVIRRKLLLPGSKKRRVRQEIRWVNSLEYQGMTMAFVSCEETDCKTGDKKTFVWLTSLKVDRDNVREITRGGRMRWKIENEGFKEQKIGYGLEHHCNCKDPDVMRGLYLILQIAHTLMQLLARSNLLEKPVETLTHLAAVLLESLRNYRPEQNASEMNLPPMQIRFARASP
jgi:hypothetical protein